MRTALLLTLSLVLPACAGAPARSTPVEVTLSAPCPSDEAWNGTGCVATPIVAPTPIARLTPTPRAVPPPPTPEQQRIEAIIAVDRDSRRFRLAPRSRQLVVAELQALETLFGAMPLSAPDRPTLMRRLAEGYVELESAARRDAQGKVGSARMNTIAAGAHASAVRFYTQSKDLYPRYCNAGATGCADEVLYYLGLEHEGAGEVALARRMYFELIQRFAQSSFIPSAYFAFGETFSREARDGAPSQWVFAKNSYAEAIKYPNAPLEPDALFALGNVCEAKGDRAKAIAYFKAFTTRFPASPLVPFVPEWAR